MNDKLKGFKEPVRSAAEQEVEEIEALETKEPELVPDPDVVVPTGDEDNPVSQPTHETALKSLFDKGRKNRDSLISRDEGDHPDVERIRRLTEEASGGEREEEGIDTNRGDRFDPEEEEVVVAEELTDDSPEVIDEPEVVNQAPDTLSELPPDARVSVKILGKHYDVPQQDIDDAGGLEVYQKNRAATIRLQRAATLEKRALQTQETVQARPAQPVADPSTDGQGEADIDSLRDELMDTVIDGTEDDINKWIENLRSRPAKTSSTEPITPSPAVDTVSPAVTETQAELQRQYNEDLEEANAMMNKDFPDIMQGSKPNATELERRRLADAQDYFRVLASDPHNEGRSQMEMAREAANRAKRIVYPEQVTKTVAPMEQERRTRVERKRKLPQTSRADTAAPASNRKQENNVPTRKEHLMRLRRSAGHDLPYKE